MPLSGNSPTGDGGRLERCSVTLINVQNGHDSAAGLCIRDLGGGRPAGDTTQGCLSGWGPAQEQRFFKRPFVRRPGIRQGPTPAPSVGYIEELWAPCHRSGSSIDGQPRSSKVRTLDVQGPGPACRAAPPGPSLARLARSLKLQGCCSRLYPGPRA